jgi:hypothetical protein
LISLGASILLAIVLLMIPFTQRRIFALAERLAVWHERELAKQDQEEEKDRRLA